MYKNGPGSAGVTVGSDESDMSGRGAYAYEMELLVWPLKSWTMYTNPEHLC